jgi:hypothetical protein
MRIQVLLGLGAAVLLSGTLAAQTVTVRTIPDNAKRANLSHVRENVMSLDGRETTLAPGGQIRGANNLLVLPVGVPRNSLVKYQLDQSGQLYRAWILTKEEAARPDKSQPATLQGRPIEEAPPQYDPARPLRFAEKPAPARAPAASTDN